MVAGLRDALAMAERDGNVSVMVIRGSGDAFCAGADLVALNSPDPDRANAGRADFDRLRRGMLSGSSEIVRLIWSCDVPVVAAVDGTAAGLGIYLALACDVVVMRNDAVFREVFVERGLAPDTGAAWLLPRLVGTARAKQMLLLGAKITGTDAAAMGLVAYGVEPGDFEARLAEVVDRLATGPDLAQRMTKRLVNRGATAGFEELLDYEATAQELVVRHPDFAEGVSAWMERRKPQFGGRRDDG